MLLTPSRFLVFLLGGVLSGGISWAGTLAQFRTPLGDLEVELFDQDKPLTTANFIRYVQSGAWGDVFIHRWEPGFVIQGGGYCTVNRHTTNAAFAVVPSFGAITNEYDVGRTFSNAYGTLAMARVGGETNSATSEWFLNLTNNAFLDQVDGGFTVFGRVVRGTNVLERFNRVSVTNGIYVLPLQKPLNTLPVLSRQPTYEDLVYADISLLHVSVQANPGGGCEISWNSASNVAHVVEFTVQFPPTWELLTRTNGTGGPLQVRDSEPTAPARFYRVRLDF
jgi:cyclophilin family peptidyl-prolyl cis-trans isomerase